MLDWPLLLSFVSLGLLGSLHCAGMCGGFAMAVAARSRKQALGLLSNQLCYILGKALTYGILGLLLATVSHWVVRFSEQPAPSANASFRSLGEWLSWTAGLVLITMGLFQFGLWPKAWTGLGQRFRMLLGPARRLLDMVRQLPGWTGSFGTGVMTGLLPCGMSWAAFLMASRTGPASAFVGCVLFGLATSPALLAVGLGSHLASARLRRLGPWLLGGALICFGALTIWRGHPSTESCCHQAAPLGRAPALQDGLPPLA